LNGSRSLTFSSILHLWIIQTGLITFCENYHMFSLSFVICFHSLHFQWATVLVINLQSQCSFSCPPRMLRSNKSIGGVDTCEKERSETEHSVLPPPQQNSWCPLHVSATFTHTKINPGHYTNAKCGFLRWINNAVASNSNLCILLVFRFIFYCLQFSHRCLHIAFVMTSKSNKMLYDNSFLLPPPPWLFSIFSVCFNSS